MSISLEPGRPTRLSDSKSARPQKSASLQNPIRLLARPGEGQPEVEATKVREKVSVPAEGLLQRLRDSQLGTRPNASVPVGKGAWATAAQSVSAKGFGAYQTTNESYEEDGVSYEKTTSTGPKGYHSTSVTYEKDGVSYVETTTSSNGNTTVRVEATEGDRTEVSTSQTTTVAGDLGDYVDYYVLHDLQVDADNVGTTTRTDSKTEVIDNSQDPPVVTVTQQSSGYSQQLKLNQVEDLEGGQQVYTPNGVSIDNQTTELPEGQYNQAESGLYVSYTVQTIPEPGTVLSSEMRITGTGTDGHPIFISNGRTATTNAQGDSQVVLRYVEKGTVAREDAEQAYLDKMRSKDEALAGQFGNAESPWLDYEKTTVYSADGSYPVTTSQFGELNHPGENSISATEVEDGTNKYVTFQKVSENGKRVQSETHIPETNFRSVSDTRYGENGEYTTSSSSYSGQVEIGSSESSRSLVYEAGKPLPKAAPVGFPQEQWDQFRQAHPNGPVYRDELESSEMGLDGLKTVTKSDAFSVDGSVVGINSQTRDSKTSEQQYFQLDGPQSQGEVIIDGLALAIDAQGKVTLDGGEVLVPANVGALLGEGQQALADLSLVIKKTPGLLNKFPSLGPGSNVLNVLTGGIQAITANNWSGRLDGAAGFSTGLSGLALLGTGARAAALAKGTGVVGGILQVSLGGLELFQHNYAEGATDVIGGAATTAAALLLVTNPALAAAFVAVAVVAGITRFILDWGDEEDKKPAYNLDGSEPDWSFA